LNAQAARGCVPVASLFLEALTYRQHVGFHFLQPPHHLLHSLQYLQDLLPDLIVGQADELSGLRCLEQFMNSQTLSSTC
jgi:hypothetical protein